MSDISRRQFLARASLAAGIAAAAPGLVAARETRRKIAKGTDVVTLGKSGIKTTLLGVGTGSHGGGRSSNQLRMGQADFTKVIRHAIDRGLTFIDTADAYGTHIFVREALKEVDRDKLFIQTKTVAKGPEALKWDIERFREELKADRLDTLLLHCRRTGSWPTDDRPLIDACLDAKEKGRVGAVGVSCHGWDPLEASVGCDWLDVHLVRINPFGATMDAEPEKVAKAIGAMHAKGRGVIGMKILGNGDNTTRPERRKSLKYVLGLGTVDCFTIGFESPQQIDEVLEDIEAVARQEV